MIACPRAPSIPEQQCYFLNCMYTLRLLTMTAEIHSVGELQATSAETGNIKYIFCDVSFLLPPAQMKNCWINQHCPSELIREPRFGLLKDSRKLTTKENMDGCQSTWPWCTWRYLSAQKACKPIKISQPACKSYDPHRHAQNHINCIVFKGRLFLFCLTFYRGFNSSWRILGDFVLRSFQLRTQPTAETRWPSIHTSAFFKWWIKTFDGHHRRSLQHSKAAEAERHWGSRFRNINQSSHADHTVKSPLQGAVAQKQITTVASVVTTDK